MGRPAGSKNKPKRVLLNRAQVEDAGFTYFAIGKKTNGLDQLNEDKNYPTALYEVNKNAK